MAKPSVEIMRLVDDHGCDEPEAIMQWLDGYVARQNKLEQLKVFLSLDPGTGSEAANNLLAMMGFKMRVNLGEDIAQVHVRVLAEAKLLGLLG